MRCTRTTGDARSWEPQAKNENRKTKPIALYEELREAHAAAKETQRTALIKTASGQSRLRYASVLTTKRRDQQGSTRRTTEDEIDNMKSFLARLTVGTSSEGGLSTTRLRHFASAWTSVPRNGLSTAVYTESCVDEKRRDNRDVAKRDVARLDLDRR